MKELINPEKLPKHIAIIMDGNGRWAKKRGAARIFGHQNAIQAVRDAAEGCAELGVDYLTLYAFSTENWGRPQDEVNGLMSLLISTIKNELPTLQKNNIRLKSIGDTDSLPAEARKNLAGAKKATQFNDGLTLLLALNYSGRWELTEAIKNIASDVEQKNISRFDISEQLIEAYLDTRGIPDPELLIRTSGEMRISNFLLWQIAYTELYIPEVLWPDFRREHLYQAILEYQRRERRFGKISEQVNP